MNARRHTTADILATGVVVTIAVLTGLFWMRALCGTLRHNWLFQAAPEVKVRLSPLLLGEQGNDANLVTPSIITARTVSGAPLLAGLGIVRYVESRRPTGPDSYVYRWDLKPDGEWIYYDPPLGQFVHKGTTKVAKADGMLTLAHFTYYAGPEGVGLSPDEKLGRFVDPIADRFRFRPWVVYDRGSARFFAIDWANRKVRKGPELPGDRRHVPVQIGVLEKSPLALWVMLAPGSHRSGSEAGPGAEEPGGPGAGSSRRVIAGPIPMINRVPVLDASGRIDLLDRDTLEFVGSEVRLPAAASLYSEGRAVTPADVAAYSAWPISEYSRAKGGRWRDAGYAAAALSRDATSVRVDVYDPNGQVVASDSTNIPQYAETSDGIIMQRASISSTQAAYFRLPGAYALTLAKLALENLHPPIFQLLSYFPASQFEATAGYRSLLLLPDSFVAMKARDKRGRPVEEFLASMMFMIPAFILVVLLVWRLDRDGSRLGLSKNERTAWVAGTVVFGLPAYITYRLTRPKVTLVTCANCGVGRRPDLEKCHRCGSPWVVPELAPPAWRVLDEESPAALGWETRKTQPGAAVPHEQASPQAQ